MLTHKVLLKCAEELNELATRLLQQVNKRKDYSEEIKEELEDVEKQIDRLKHAIYNNAISKSTLTAPLFPLALTTLNIMSDLGSNFIGNGKL